LPETRKKTRATTETYVVTEWSILNSWYSSLW